MRRVCALCLRNFTFAVTAALLCLFAVRPDSALALSLGEYYDITSDVEFSTTQVGGTESFEVTVTAQATCKKKFVISPSEVYLASRIVAENTETHETVVLNSSYSMTISPFPDDPGETRQVQVAVPLQFPSGSSSGNYTVTAELVQAKIDGWFDVTGQLSSYATQVMGTVSYYSSGGGLGTTGGGGSASKTVSITGLTSNILLTLNASGYVEESVRLYCTGADAYIHIEEGVKILDRNGYATSSLTSAVVGEPPEPAPETVIVLAVDFGPDGVTFDPAIELVMDYNLETLPEGVMEEELYIAWWNGSEWKTLPSVLDVDSGTISAQVSHFTEFAVTGVLHQVSPPRDTGASGNGTAVEVASVEESDGTAGTEPPAFKVSNFSITPDEAAPDQAVTVSAIVTNTGAGRAKYPVVFKMNGEIFEEKTLVVDPGIDYRVIFEVVPESIGVYEVDINGLSGTFTVAEKEPEKEAGEETMTPGTGIEEESAEFVFRLWHLIAGAAAVILLIVLPVTILVVRRMRG